MTAPDLPAAGLTAVEAERRLAHYGPNDPARQKPRSHLVDLLLQFANPLVAILLLASVVSASVDELVNAAIIIVIVSLSAVINFVQTFRSQRATERLRATVAPTATVLRDGAFVDRPRVDVVPSDVVRLSAGDLVPADARKQKVIVKHLSAIHNLGSVDILCSDKTGTLTLGIMAFDSSCDALGSASEAPLFFARLNSKFETGIRSPLVTAILARPEAEGSSAYTKVDEIPFDFERRRLSIVVDKPGERRLIAKGAPEGILAAATAYARGGKEPVPLDDDARAKSREAYEALSTRGFRVLAVATRKVVTKPAYSAAEKIELVLAPKSERAKLAHGRP